MLRTSHSGSINDSGGRMRPAIALNCIGGSPVTSASTRIGLPTPPQATGAVLAIKHKVAAWNGGKPRPIRNDPAIATGAPPPPVPSKKAPKQKAISTNCNRLSDDSPAMDCFITSNWPVSQATLYKKIEATMTQAMRIMPKMNPCPAAATTNTAGILKTSSASNTAINKPHNADTQTRAFTTTSTKNSVSTGKAETAVESGHEFNGS